MNYWRSLASMTTRWLNSLFGGDRRGESVSSAVARKALEGRRLFIIAEALINVPFAVLGERYHCERRLDP